MRIGSRGLWSVGKWVSVAAVTVPLNLVGAAHATTLMIDDFTSGAFSKGAPLTTTPASGTRQAGLDTFGGTRRYLVQRTASSGQIRMDLDPTSDPALSIAQVGGSAATAGLWRLRYGCNTCGTLLDPNQDLNLNTTGYDQHLALQFVTLHARNGHRADAGIAIRPTL